MFLNNKKIINKWYIISFSMIFLGVLVGALYYTYKFSNTADVKNYLDGYVNSLRNGMSLRSVIYSSIKSYSIMFILIFLSSFSKCGPILAFFLLIRKGFVNAFTTSALINVYGLGGIALSLSCIVQIMVLVPLMAVFSAVTAFTSQNKGKFEKRDKIIYIIFSMAIFTIFCGCALLEGILNTTFMKWVAFKVT